MLDQPILIEEGYASRARVVMNRWVDRMGWSVISQLSLALSYISREENYGAFDDYLARVAGWEVENVEPTD